MIARHLQRPVFHPSSRADATDAVAYVVIAVAFFALYFFAGGVRAAPRFEVSVIVETDADRRSADAAIIHAAGVYQSQLGIDLVVTVTTVATVAAHTNPDALLDALQVHRLDRAALIGTDATVLFTRRDLTRRHEGIATIGPACSAAAAAVVRLRDDGYDGQVLAHELLHTLGVPHDVGAGWLMSESVSRYGSDTVSPDSAMTVRAAPLDCMTVATAAGPAPVTAGGGAFEWGLIVVLAALVIYARLIERNRKRAHGRVYP